jgi:Ca-activated chloride channel family protein
MSFIWPFMLILLLVVPLLAWLYVRLQRRRRQFAASFGSMGLVQAGAGRKPLGRRRHLPAVLFLVGLTVLLTGMARPQAEISLPRIEGTVILAFDVSGSMAATDIQPTRMEAAKVAAREFVQRQPSTVQIGIVAFSDSGLAVQPPTNDQAALLAAINRLSPQRGTSLGQGMLTALNTIAAAQQPGERLYSNLTATPEPLTPASGAPSAAVVLLTDGENNEAPNPSEVARAAAERGVRIYTVGVGSPAGTTLKANGFTIHTQLDEPALQEIAQLTEGAYYNAASQQDLESIYQNLDLQLVVRPEQTEVSALFAIVGTLLLLIGGALSLLWFGRVP